MADRTYYSQEAQERAMRERTALAAACIVFGLGIGAVLALLFAPSSGDKTRNELTSSLSNGTSSAFDAIQNLEGKVSNLTKKLENIR